MDYKDYYKILEIDKKATPAEVKKAYRTLAKKYHPDKNLGDKKAEENFKLVNEANEVLGNPEKRKKYDDLGENWQQNQQAQNQQQGQNRQYRQQNQGFGGGNQEDFSDFFEQFFAQQRGGNPQQNQSRKGGDYETEMEISLEEAYTGTSRIIQLENEKLRVTTKPGAYTDQQLRIKNKGAKGSSDANRGDLFVRIRVIDNPKFIRKGDDLHQTATINLYDAILGNDIIIETISGKLKIKIPAGTQNGKTIRLKGKGMPVYEKAGTFGDFYMLIQIEIPIQLTDKQKALFEELKAIS
ncbi:DnaJ C-terminal domain-containing protein [Flavobacterium restrictum]|uniref:J domain-containing protein n=1 Tax=Flavobacterium restrictum TaxID=2594428 RepID=A0A553EDM8_9FLAO|nr:J domain-containing protein [Flavobacterium restrictum]TRX43140.1 J domain-containing protein [Flavobacterium restrictum]